MTRLRRPRRKQRSRGWRLVPSFQKPRKFISKTSTFSTSLWSIEHPRHRRGARKTVIARTPNQATAAKNLRKNRRQLRSRPRRRRASSRSLRTRRTSSTRSVNYQNIALRKNTTKVVNNQVLAQIKVLKWRLSSCSKSNKMKMSRINHRSQRRRPLQIQTCSNLSRSARSWWRSSTRTLKWLSLQYALTVQYRKVLSK